ncbi:DUF1090 domain-containing protein [Vibrio rumoiensis]|uniref:DUF1090 domain-containing protein n=1 Tax=Vibrio rumoiensis 1S-45 TaxID=1188252 RepID=A0A1E5E485_9VIBR|nr:DUF1090 domain-containing protein [Vibrio rumoiensis]OEF27557.1 hypothetical protein A1QC_06445 [Vibrio rumoiensis 1S-45]
MKLTSLLLPAFFTLASSAVFAQDCSDKTGCEEKICQIEKQLDLAKQNNNSHKEKGLTTALQNAKEHCTTDGLSDDLKGKIDDVKDDMSEHQDDLKEAMKDQKFDKVSKYKEKLAEDNKKLEQLNSELNKLQ